MGINLCRLVLYLALLLLLLSVVSVVNIDSAAPGYAPAVLSVALNALTAAGAAVCIRRMSRRKGR